MQFLSLLVRIHRDHSGNGGESPAPSEAMPAHVIRVSLDLEKCCGHGRCHALCPEVFEEDEAGYAVLIRHEVPPQLEAQTRRAVENCPESALVLVKEEPAS